MKHLFIFAAAIALVSCNNHKKDEDPSPLPFYINAKVDIKSSDAKIQVVIINNDTIYPQTYQYSYTFKCLSGSKQPIKVVTGHAESSNSNNRIDIAVVNTGSQEQLLNLYFTDTSSDLTYTSYTTFTAN
jgi:hypothetical protein